MIDSRPVTILTYHHIADTPSPATRFLGATTSTKAFARQIDWMRTHYTIIGLDRLLDGDIPDRAAVLTFDDAYASIARVAAPLLAQHRLPSVFFANSGPIASGIVPLDALASVVCSRDGPRVLARVASDGTIAADSFGAVMDGYIAHLDLHARAAVKQRLFDHLGNAEAILHAQLGLFMSPRELASLPGLGMEVANHTRSHVHCGAMSRAELEAEIAVGRDELEAITGTPVRAFAFPWGRHRDATSDALDVVRQSGHRATFLVHGRSNRRRPAADIWYRVLLTESTGYRLRTELTLLPGLRDLVARLRGGAASATGAAADV